MSEYENLRTADIVAEALIDWDVDTIFGLPGDGINGFMESLRQRQSKIRFILVRHEESAAFHGLRIREVYEKAWCMRCYVGPGSNTSYKWVV
jgi:pyruvate dehydrogenase (quinone)/pyruvate oxidase